MKRLLTFTFVLFSLHILAAQVPTVKTGVEVLQDRQFDILAGKRIGLITNPTGVDSRLESTIDILFNSDKVKVVALFGPEHGVRGDQIAGDNVESYIDPRTKLPVYSLYGATRKPTPRMLKDIDMLVYDIQDVGCRSYTYISTMGLAMEAAAENHIDFVVLDRPNPLGGIRVEGNILEPGFASFVGQYPIPYVYGLTCGELARFLNGEHLLKSGMTCSLTVVPMKGWRRDMSYAATGLQWVSPSPHIPAGDSPMYYASTGILGELGVISEGVGTPLPFRFLAAEWIDPAAVAGRLNALRTGGIIFRPATFKPFYGRDSGKTLNGVQLHIIDDAPLNLFSIQFLFLQVHNELYPGRNPFLLADSTHVAMFDKVVGSDQIRRQFTRRMLYADVKEYLDKDTGRFRAASKQYLLY